MDHLSVSPNGRAEIVGGDLPSGAWVLSHHSYTPSGAEFTGPADMQACGENSSKQTCFAWIDSLELRDVSAYQPANRFWAFQGIETGVFVALAAVLLVITYAVVRRRDA